MTERPIGIQGGADMSADMPKPVARTTGRIEGSSQYLIESSVILGVYAKLFTETQLREYAEAKCAELRAAADGMMKKADEMIRRCAVGELMQEDIEELVSSISAYQSAREPRP